MRLCPVNGTVPVPSRAILRSASATPLLDAVVSVSTSLPGCQMSDSDFRDLAWVSGNIHANPEYAQHELGKLDEDDRVPGGAGEAVKV